jgi:hypothetical protein
MICPAKIQQEYADNILDPTEIGWHGFESHMKTIWTKAISKQHMLLRVKMTAQVTLQGVKAMTSNQTQPPISTSMLPAPTDLTSESADIPIACRVYAAQFMFIVAQHETHKRLGFASQPARRRTCKRQKDGMESKKRPCFKFQTGDCPYGDACIFSHVQPSPLKLICVVTTEDSNDDPDDDEGFQVVRPKKQVV